MSSESVAVVDASAIIALTQIGRLDLLPHLFGRVLAPPAVVRESMPTLLEVPQWLGVVVPDPGVRPPCGGLGPGEYEAIVLSLGTAYATLISDDARARRCATSLGIAVRGCAGLAVDAKRRGLVDLARPMIDELVAVGLWLSMDVYFTALREAGEAD